MRRLAWVLVVIAALLAPLLSPSPASADHSSDPIITGSGATVHWMQSAEGATVRRNGRLVASLERRIHVIVPAEYASDGEFMHAINHAVQQGDRSPYIDMILDVPAVAPTNCPDYQCITVYRQPMNGAVASMGWDPQGHMNGRAVTVGFDIQNGAWLLGAACHEIAGHGLGLAHPGHEPVWGPCRDTTLSDHDLNLINTAHAHKDSKVWGYNCFSWGCPSTSTLGQKVVKTHSHSKEFYRNLGG